MLQKEMGFTDFSGTADEERGRINGLNPWPCVSIPFGDKCQLKLLRAVCTEGQGSPGVILKADPREGLVIACREGAVKILELQAPGGKRMRTEDYLRGHDLIGLRTAD